MPRFTILDNRRPARAPKPRWLKVRAPGGGRYEAIRERMEGLSLWTVCQEAHCPNIGECWDGGTATLMLMGGVCTRGCRFCHVVTGRPAPLDPDEPRNAAAAVASLGVDYIVLTSVNRDDLADGGAAHFAETVRELKSRQPTLLVEVLIPDFQGELSAVDAVLQARPEVIAHNVETVPRLTRSVRDARASFEQSVAVLRHVVERGGGEVLAKTSLMVGLGEEEHEVLAALRALREAGVSIVTLGQYLQPSRRHLEVVEYVSPERFDRYAELAREVGFLYVASGPLVRSSYRAGELFLKGHLEARRGAPAAAGRR